MSCSFTKYCSKHDKLNTFFGIDILVDKLIQLNKDILIITCEGKSLIKYFYMKIILKYSGEQKSKTFFFF